MYKLIFIIIIVWAVSCVGGGSGGALSEQVLADIASAMAREATRDIKDDDTSFLHRCITILAVFCNLIIAIVFEFKKKKNDKNLRKMELIDI